MSQIYRYCFDDEVPITAVRDSLLVAAFSAEGIHGQAQVRLDAAFLLDEERRCCALDGSTLVGQTIAQILTSFLLHELGEPAFTVERVTASGTTGLARLEQVLEAVR